MDRILARQNNEGDGEKRYSYKEDQTLNIPVRMSNLSLVCISWSNQITPISNSILLLQNHNQYWTTDTYGGSERGIK